MIGRLINNDNNQPNVLQTKKRMYVAGHFTVAEWTCGCLCWSNGF